MKRIRTLQALREVEAKDGIIALMVTALYIGLMFYSLDHIPLDSRYIYIQIGLQAVWLLVLYLIVRLRGQGLSSLGISRAPLPYVAALTMTVAAGIYSAVLGNAEIFGRWIFYLVAVGGLEELLFRGFLYPRLTKLVRSPFAGMILTGLLFGAVHGIAPIVWEGARWTVIFNDLLGTGILMNFLFLYIYARTGSIINAILLHAAMDYWNYMPLMPAVCILYIVVLIFWDRRKTNKEKM